MLQDSINKFKKPEDLYVTGDGTFQYLFCNGVKDEADQWIKTLHQNTRP